jgi:hypothetical protein
MKNYIQKAVLPSIAIGAMAALAVHLAGDIPINTFLALVFVTWETLVQYDLLHIEVGMNASPVN